MTRTNRRDIKTSLPRLRTALPGTGWDMGRRMSVLAENEDSFLMLARMYLARRRWHGSRV